eukprot:4770190-Pyramimonas_sp.AAC.1
MGPSASRLAAQSAFVCPVASNHRAWRSAAPCLLFLSAWLGSSISEGVGGFSIRNSSSRARSGDG